MTFHPGGCGHTDGLTTDGITVTMLYDVTGTKENLDHPLSILMSLMYNDVIKRL